MLLNTAAKKKILFFFLRHREREKMGESLRALDMINGLANR